MLSIPPEALPLLHELCRTFTKPTARRAVLLLFAALLTTGRHTVANLLRTVGSLARGSASGYRRVLSHARFSGLRLAGFFGRFLVRHGLPQGPLPLVGDDTVCEHRGKKVYGKARHRDAVRSSHSYTAYRYGHKWVVLAVLVRRPWSSRLWALPLLVALYRSPEDNRQRGRRHQTPAQRMQLLLRILCRWFPDRSFVFAGDAGFGSHEMAAFAAARPGRLCLVSRFHAGANLYEPPPPVAGKKPAHRPRKKGAKLPRPEQVVASSRLRLLQVSWYGGGRRRVAVVSGVGHWYKGGQGLVAVRWVYVQDRTGTHRDDYLYSTDVTQTAQQIIETYTGRWNIETLFQEARAYLGLETTCGRCRQTVLRAEPCLIGLYGVVAWLYEQLPPPQGAGVQWEGKQGVTFSDALMAVRRWLWQAWAFETDGHRETFAKLPDDLQELLLGALAPPA